MVIPVYNVGPLNYYIGQKVLSAQADAYSQRPPAYLVTPVDPEHQLLSPPLIPSAQINAVDHLAPQPPPPHQPPPHQPLPHQQQQQQSRWPWPSSEDTDFTAVMRLFERCSSAQMSDLTQLDSLLSILFEGAVPHWATTPPGDAFARYKAVQSQMERLHIDGQLSAFPPIRSDGWAGVFGTMRVLLCTARNAQQIVAAPAAALQQNNDGGGSFGRGALHLLTQRSSSLTQSSAVGVTSEMQTAVLTAAAAVDAESRLPVDQRPIFQAVHAMNGISAGVDGTDIARLRALGAAFEDLPQAALQLDNLGSASFNPSISAGCFAYRSFSEKEEGQETEGGRCALTSGAVALPSWR